MTDETCDKTIPGSAAHYFNSSSTALRLSVLVLLLVATSGMAPIHGGRAWNAVAADQKPNSGTCNIVEKDAAGLNGDFTTDIHAARDYAGGIALILKEEKFEELDCLADRARSTKERFPGGMWKLHELYKGLYSPVQYPVKHATQEDWNILIRRLQRWIAERPKSVTARIALAWVYVDYADDTRGNGYANTVSESGWKLYGERTAEAKRILDEASALPTKCPEWYVAMQEVGQNQSWDVAEERALYDRATKFEPGYYYYARVFANILLPKWSGEPGDTEKFVQEAADRLGGDQGNILYFQVASSKGVICGCNDNPHLSWERIERGFEAVEKQYGVSMWNLNRIAYLASYFGERDPIVADKALTRIAEQWDEDSWGSKENFEAAKKWAHDYAPIMAKRREMRAAAEANMQTPGGLAYKASFEKTYRELVQQCVRTEGDSVTQWEGKFETLTSVGAKGTVEDVRIQSSGPLALCLYQKLHGFQIENGTPFPPPPQAPYWVKLDLDWAEFAPAAAK
jgi:hypothetical protein